MVYEPPWHVKTSEHVSVQKLTHCNTSVRIKAKKPASSIDVSEVDNYG